MNDQPTQTDRTNMKSMTDIYFFGDVLRYGAHSHEYVQELHGFSVISDQTSRSLALRL